MQRQKTKGDWRRFGTINVKVVTAYVKWQKLVTPEQGAGSSEEELDDVDTDNIKTFITEIPVGMKNVLTKMESQQNRALNQLPLAIKEGLTVRQAVVMVSGFLVGCGPTLEDFIISTSTCQRTLPDLCGGIGSKVLETYVD